MPTPISVLEKLVDKMRKEVENKIKNNRIDHSLKEWLKSLLKKLANLRETISKTSHKDIVEELAYTKTEYYKLLEVIEREINCDKACKKSRQQNKCKNQCSELRSTLQQQALKADFILNTCYNKNRASDLNNRLQKLLAKNSEKHAVSKLATLLLLIIYAKTYDTLKESSEWLWELTRAKLNMPYYTWRGDLSTAIYLTTRILNNKNIEINKKHEISINDILSYIENLLT